MKKRPKNAKMYGNMQMGGPNVFTSQQQIDTANDQARQFALRRGLVSGENTYVARNVGDPMPQYRGNGVGVPGANSNNGLSSFVPQGVTSLEWNSERNLPFYTDPQTGDIQYTTPENFYAPRFQQGRQQQAQMASQASMMNTTAKRRMGGRYRTMQRGGMMYQQSIRDQYPMINTGINFNQPLQESDVIPGVNAPLPEVANPMDRMQEGVNNGIIQQPNGYDSSQKWYDDMKKRPNDHPAPDTPRNWKQPLGIGIKAVRTLLSEISGRVARGRQNQYDFTQQTALGQMNPMPTDGYQPTPYQPYAKMGGLQHVDYFGPPFSNGAKMKFDGNDKYDEVIINRKVIPEVLRLAKRR